ncbi:hypothetical protein crov432 [Cafeteria roenbergensis virus]|uniref:Uncharacterized protein n=1 Tax=Cafeteria roenbergensis virus (strain BV-PW1) TaxID=693272 RepID=E3T5K3_CROVB|nr:hypothetical protein crov432 [Cafeteria roenbergensis virus BV-PW1]ADO67466.1 hypothetical protein crov432 [Cafeteria roenbergensis virus BV-PW1]
MSFTKKINIKKMLLQIDNFVTQFRFCPTKVQERVNKIIKINSDLIIESNTIIQLNFIRNIIDQITEEIKNCTSITPVPDIYNTGRVDTPLPDDELDKIVSNLTNAYKQLNNVIGGRINFLTDINLIILLNFILTYHNPHWKNSLDKLSNYYKIGGRTQRERKISLKNTIYKKLFGGTIRNYKGIPTESGTQYYFSIYRREKYEIQNNKKFFVVKEQLQILDEMGFGKYRDIIEKRIKQLKYFLKYLVYKNKYLTLKNNLNL